MSEKLFRFLLSEVKVVRVKCSSCQQTMELSLNRLGPAFNNGACPLCHKTYAAVAHHGKLVDLMGMLAQAIEGIQAQKEVEVSFTLEDKTP